MSPPPPPLRTPFPTETLRLPPPHSPGCHVHARCCSALALPAGGTGRTPQQPSTSACIVAATRHRHPAATASVMLAAREGAASCCSAGRSACRPVRADWEVAVIASPILACNAPRPTPPCAPPSRAVSPLPSPHSLPSPHRAPPYASPSPTPVPPTPLQAPLRLPRTSPPLPPLIAPPSPGPCLLRQAVVGGVVVHLKLYRLPQLARQKP